MYMERLVLTLAISFGGSPIYTTYYLTNEILYSGTLDQPEYRICCSLQLPVVLVIALGFIGVLLSTGNRRNPPVFILKIEKAALPATLLLSDRS
jgi:hypothetical protein